MRGGWKHDHTGRTTGKPRDRRVHAVLGLPKGLGFSVAIPRDVLDSPAFIALSRMSPNGLRFVLAVLAEHTRNNGYENGNLAVPYDDIAGRGIRRSSIRQAIGDVVAVGLVKITARGGRSYGGNHRPSRYQISWLGSATEDGTWPAGNEWRKVTTVEEGERLIQKSREAKVPAKREDEAANEQSEAA